MQQPITYTENTAATTADLDTTSVATTDLEPMSDQTRGTMPADGAERAGESTREATGIWKQCIEALRPELSAQTMRTWFEPLVPTAFDGSQLTLQAPSNFFREWIGEHYQTHLERALAGIMGVPLTFRIESTREVPSVNTTLGAGAAPVATRSEAPRSQPTAQANTPRMPAQQPMRQAQSAQPLGAPATGVSAAAAANMQAKRPPIESNLNPRYVFDTFIRGESNKLAYAAALAVANNPGGTRYNPLVIFGNVGLGKTHLIQAIGNAVATRFTGARVLYTSSDRFGVEFVDAIQNGRINEFQALYRSIDVLIIDDVQFLTGREKTQDMFFHTFNALRELGKQIILTCDRPPKELKDIDDRLLNRLQWGLTADIGAPDLETRIAILRHKAVQDGIDLPNEVIEFIATNVTTNIRELEGCLISLLATASLESKEPTLEVAKEVLRKIAKRSAPILTIETIQRTVSKKFGIDEELLRAKTRKQEIVEARQVAMFFAKELTTNSLKNIGLHFGGRDHSTVIHAVQTVLDDLKNNASLRAKVEELRRQFEMMQ